MESPGHGRALQERVSREQELRKHDAPLSDRLNPQTKAKDTLIYEPHRAN
jgi:hypothetical protein